MLNLSNWDQVTMMVHSFATELLKLFGRLAILQKTNPSKHNWDQWEYEKECYLKRLSDALALPEKRSQYITHQSLIEGCRALRLDALPGVDYLVTVIRHHLQQCRTYGIVMCGVCHQDLNREAKQLPICPFCGTSFVIKSQVSEVLEHQPPASLRSQAKQISYTNPIQIQGKKDETP